jgi:hypothetical protein
VGSSAGAPALTALNGSAWGMGTGSFGDAVVRPGTRLLGTTNLAAVRPALRALVLFLARGSHLGD